MIGEREHAAASAALDVDELIALAIEICDGAGPWGGELPGARMLANRMSAMGLSSQVQEFTPGRANAVGRLRGRGGGSSLIFVGHLDVSGTVDSPPIPSPARVVDGEWLSGLAMWNMNASTAAFLAAVAAITRAGVPLRGDVLVAGVAGSVDVTRAETRLREEAVQGYSIGTKHLLGRGGVADYGIVGEPTSFVSVEQHFGAAAFRIDIRTRTRFLSFLEGEEIDDFVGSYESADDPLPADAISHAASVVEAIRAWAPGYRRRNTVERRLPFVSVAGIEGGSASARFMPGTSSVFVFVATPPGASPAAATAELRELLDELGGVDPSFRAELELYSFNPGPSVSSDDPIAVAVSESHRAVFGTPARTAVVDWHSDASALSLYGIPAVNYGPPGRIPAGIPGQPNPELVRVDDLLDCARVYLGAILRICG